MNKEVQDLLADIQKKYGKDSLFVFNQGVEVDKSIKFFPTGSFELDIAVSNGRGFPRGRVIEIEGPEASGKTTITLMAVAELQKMGGKVAYIDAEHALSKEWAEKLGVNFDELLLSQPTISAEQVYNMIYDLIESDQVDLIVIDSLNFLVPKAELEKGLDESTVAELARVNSRAMRKLVGPLAKHETSLIVLNQIREKIGGFSPTGVATTTAGGRAIRHAYSVQLRVRSGEPKKGKQYHENGSEIDVSRIGNRIEIEVIKNKVGIPYRKAGFDVFFETGVDRQSELVELALFYKVVNQSGAWIKMYDENGEEIAKWQGKAQFSAALSGEDGQKYIDIIVERLKMAVEGAAA